MLDSGSRDSTRSIAKEFKAQVFQESWKGFAEQKNSAQGKAKGPWILNIDADERVTEALRLEIQKVLQEDPPVSGFRVPRKNFFCGQWIRHGGWYPNYQLRLYRKEAGRFAPREVHEQVEVKGPVGTLTSPLEHYTYRSISDYIKRMDRYSELSARQYLKEGRRVSWPGILFRSWVHLYSNVGSKKGISGRGQRADIVRSLQSVHFY